MPRNSREAAARTRAAVLERAVDLGSVHGLENTTIGLLSDDLGLSKSGVIGPFGSKEQLHLEAVQAAAERFRDAVWAPGAGEPRGMRRLRAWTDAWLSYLERDVFPGGCFLTAASLEFDGRPGAVRDAVAAAWRPWLHVLEREVAAAQEQGELDPDLPPAQVVFQLHGYVMAGNWAKQLFGDDGALAASRRAIDALLSSNAEVGR